MKNFLEKVQHKIILFKHKKNLENKAGLVYSADWVPKEVVETSGIMEMYMRDGESIVTGIKRYSIEIKTK